MKVRKRSGEFYEVGGKRYLLAILVIDEVLALKTHDAVLDELPGKLAFAKFFLTDAALKCGFLYTAYTAVTGDMPEEILNEKTGKMDFSVDTASMIGKRCRFRVAPQENNPQYVEVTIFPSGEDLPPWPGETSEEFSREDNIPFA